MSEQNLPVTPDGSQAPASVNEQLSALNREVLAEAGVSAEPMDEPLEASDGETEIDATSAEEVIEEEAPPEADNEGEMEAEGSDSEPVEEPQESKPWDGNPDTVPDSHRAYFDQMAGTMKKGFNVKAQALAEEKRQYENARLQYEQATLQMQQAPQQQAPSGPPKPPEQGASEADWQRHEQAVAEHHNAPMRAELDDLRNRQAIYEGKAKMDERLVLISNQPGATDAILQRMRDMVDADHSLSDAFGADNTAIQFFNQAKLAIEQEAFAKEQAEFAKDKAKAATATATRKAGAAGRASSRPGSTTTAPSSPEQTFASRTFGSTEEKLKFLNSETLRESRAG